MNNIFDVKVSWFENITTIENGDFATIESLLNSIKFGGRDFGLARKIAGIRCVDNKDNRDALKRKLPVIMWQGDFNSRCKMGLQRLSGIVCIDVDHIGAAGVNELKSIMATVPWCIAAFRSPSGDGLKILVYTDITDPTIYENCYRQLEDMFANQFNIEIDKRCRNYAQGCIASYDPEILINLNAQPLHMEFKPEFESMTGGNIIGIEANFTPVHISNTQRMLNQLHAQMENLSDEQILKILDIRFHRYPDNYVDGNRTKSIFVQASELCKAGVPYEMATDYLLMQFNPTGYNPDKLRYEVCRAYDKNNALYGSKRGEYKSYRNYNSSKP